MIPHWFTHYVASGLFAVFGLKMLKEGSVYYIFTVIIRAVATRVLDKQCFTEQFEKIAKIGPIYMRYSTKYASFFAMLYQTFINELCQLRSYWTEAHKIFHDIEASFTLLMRTLR